MESSTSITKRILIAIPSNTGRDTYPVPFAQSLIHACREIPSEYHVDVHYFGGLRVDIVRNSATIYAIKHNYDALLFLDDDMIFPRDALIKLIRHWDQGKLIISGVYTSKAPPFHAFIYPANKTDYPEGQTTDWLRQYDPTKIYEVKTIATGCVLIDISVFGVLPKPWFLLRMDQSGTQITCTEDCYFGLCCHRLGYKMYVDASIECQHCSYVAFPQFFENPALHYDGEWRDKKYNHGIPTRKGPMVISPLDNFYWHDGLDKCAHQHQYPLPVNVGETQTYRCLDCGLISTGEDIAGANILDLRVMNPKELGEHLKSLEDMTW